VLQSLDPARLELSERLVIVLATTNEPHLVDTFRGLKVTTACPLRFRRTAWATPDP
jgi:hypothetical protein